jgi:hypothetical protein
MSYDLQVWSVRPLHPDAFRDTVKWQKESSAWIHARKNWQIVVSASDRVEPGDIPEEISKLLPGIEWLTNLNLEGKTTAEALKLAQSSAADIARYSHGAVLDQQDGSIRLPSGVKRLMSPRSKETFDVLSMSWWFLDSPLESREGRERFVELLEHMFPECLPKRYGLYEPPQHVYAQTGREHFLQFLDENLHDFKIWYPHRPVVSVNLGLPSPVGAHQLGFRTNHLGIEIEKSVLLEPGWAINLQQFWRQTSLLIHPFYGDVRALGNYQWMGATVSGGEEHPVNSWWWAGIPEKLGMAVVLGDVYQKLWPTFVAASALVDGLAFASLPDWINHTDLTEKVGRPPEEHTQIPDRFGGVMSGEEFRDYWAEVSQMGAQNVRRAYPQGWPFGEPFAS